MDVAGSISTRRASRLAASARRDFAAYYLLAHSATTVGAAIWAGNAPRCYVTRFAGDELIRCASLPKGVSSAGCPNGVDPRQAACDPSVRPCPPGYGLNHDKCQGEAPGTSKWIAAQNVTELQSVARRRGRAGLIDDPRTYAAGASSSIAARETPLTRWEPSTTRRPSSPALAR